MRAHAALQKAIHDHLVSDSAVSAIVGDRVLDDVPGDLDYPLIAFGARDGVPTDDVDRCVNGMEIAMQIDCWSQDQGRLRPAAELAEAVAAALHRADISLGDGLRLIEMRAYHRAFMDSDRITGHGIVTVEAEIEGL